MSQASKIQALLAAEGSAQRSRLIAVVLDAVLARKVGDTIDRAQLIESVYHGLTGAVATTIAERYVLPAADRVAVSFAGHDDRVRDLLGARAEQQILALVRQGQGPRFGWLKGALDADDLRQLMAPVVQQLLFAFVNKLPIPGIGKPSGLGGLVGAISKQVSRSMGDLADVGRTVMGSFVKDFSQGAISDFRDALRVRMQTEEGREILERMRERLARQVLAAKADTLLTDLLSLPRKELAQVVSAAIDQLRTQPTFRAALERELHAVVDHLCERSAGELLQELDLLEVTRAQVAHVADPIVKDLAAGESFGRWLEDLLAEGT
ncbi:MAG TPA: hypothetical protein VI299_23425 [Polyangiales bacterium]